MKKIFYIVLSLMMFATSAEAKHYIITVENNTRVPVNWDAFVSRSGGAVVEKYDFIDGALLDLSEEQVSRLRDNRVPGMTIEEDRLIRLILEKKPSAKKLADISGVSAADLNKIPVSRPAAQNAASAPSSRGPFDELYEYYKPKGEYPWNIIRMDLNEVWKLTQGQGVKVAVVDSGINYEHPDLKPNYAGGINCVKEGNPPLDDNGHGTHVAGIIAGAFNNSGIIGIAPKASLYSVKVMRRDGYGKHSDILKGIEWCVKNNMHIMNMSLGVGEGYEAVNKAVKVAVANNITVVCAAGNESEKTLIDPARIPETIAVTASDPNDQFAYFSNSGKGTDFIAPGMFIYSSFKKGYEFHEGTSMACPHITGMAALAYSLGYRTPDQIRAALRASAVKLGRMAVVKQGYGMPLGSRLAQYYQGTLK